MRQDSFRFSSQGLLSAYSQPRHRTRPGSQSYFRQLLFVLSSVSTVVQKALHTTSVYVALLVFEKLNNTTQQNAFSIPNYEFFTTTSNDIYMLLWAAPRHVLKS